MKANAITTQRKTESMNTAVGTTVTPLHNDIPNNVKVRSHTKKFTNVWISIARDIASGKRLHFKSSKQNISRSEMRYCTLFYLKHFLKYHRIINNNIR